MDTAMRADRTPGGSPGTTTGGRRPLRVVVGDEDVLLREGLARILNGAGFDVVARCGDADDLLRRTLAHLPDIAVADVRMPPRREDDGLRAAVEVRRRAPGVAVLMLSRSCEPAAVVSLIGDRPGGVGYLLRERVVDVGAFVDAVGRVAAGGSALDPEVVGLVVGRRTPDDPLLRLTGREQQVLAAMAEGRSNLGIARALFVSRAAVEKHVTAIFRKLGIAPADSEHRRVQAVLAYLRHRDGGRA